MRTTPLALLLSVSLALPAFAASPTKGKADAVHGPKGAKPGSYEDWCGEHGVPESLDTRCNPKLAAVYKAKGDWCAEHDRPETQCVPCHPELAKKGVK